jgi:hypothetical protein
LQFNLRLDLGISFSKEGDLMKKILLLVLALPVTVFAHEMQHGFILSNQDKLGSHLVATGHHSHQVEIEGELLIEDATDRELYNQRKAVNTAGRVYFLFQAQQLDMPGLSGGQVLSGHIVESQVGKYEPRNIIVRAAKFKVDKVLLNIPNPFFTEESSNDVVYFRHD